MRDQKCRIDLPLLDQLEQRLKVAVNVGLAGLHGQPFFHEGADRELVGEAAIDAWH